MTSHKQLLWIAAGGSFNQDGTHVPGSANTYLITIAASNIGEPIPGGDYEKIMREVMRMKENQIPTNTPVYKLAPVPQIEPEHHDHRARYTEAHRLNFKEQYPAAWADGLYSPPVFPKVGTSNGLTTYIVNFLNWQGYRATRINVSGRLIMSPQKQESGVILNTRKYMKSATRKGTADISSTIRGKSVQWEIKIGKDRPSEHQIAEQRRERRAGGEYFFVHTVDEFLTLFDSLVYG